MQSFLAYKHIGSRAREQYDREVQRSKALEQCRNKIAFVDGNEEYNIQTSRPSSNDTSLSSTEVRQKSPDTRDFKKAEQPDKGKGDGDSRILQEREGGDIERNTTARTSMQTRTFGTRFAHAFPGIEVCKSYGKITRHKTESDNPHPHTQIISPSPTLEEIFIVSFESSQDPTNPHNWSHKTRISTTLIIALISLVIGIASSIDSGVLPQAASSFVVSPITESLATGLFLVGFGAGALFAGPISETVGRNPVYIVTMFIYMLFIMASGLARIITEQLVFRFLAGFFGSTPLTCAGGSISDLWSPMERVYVFPLFAPAALTGPVLGLAIAGFIGESRRLGWRWSEWITLIVSGVVLVLVVLYQPETYVPVLLRWKARHLRRATGDSRFVAEVEVRDEGFVKRLRTALYRPLVMLALEPIVLLFALYLTVVYIVLSTFLDEYTYIFGQTYGFSQGITGLAFLGIEIGFCLATLLIPLINHWAKRDLHQAQRGRGLEAQLAPEKRLYFAMFGAPALPISLFWMGWTNYPEISYWSGLLASVLFGYGVLCIFIGTYQYIIDSYELFAASALGSLTVVRYVVSGGMVEVGIPFYENLGVHWTLTVLGGISAVMVPVPYTFYWYGPKIRGWSKYAVDKDG